MHFPLHFSSFTLVFPDDFYHFRRHFHQKSHSFSISNQFKVFGGYFSDQIGGQRVIFVAAVIWSLITFWMPELLLMTSRQWTYSIPFIVFIRVIHGASQGVHFPSMISITSQVSFYYILLFLRFHSICHEINSSPPSCHLPQHTRRIESKFRRAFEFF